VQKLLEMAGGQQGDLFRCDGYKQQLETIGSCLWLLGHVSKDHTIQSRKDVNNICDKLQVVNGDFREKSARQLAGGYVACKYILDDIPDQQARRRWADLGHLESSLVNLSGGINKGYLSSAKARFEESRKSAHDQLEVTIGNEESEGVSEFRFNPKTTTATSRSGDRKSDSVVDAIKTYKLSIDMIEEIEKQLPLADIRDGYSQVVTALQNLSSQMKQELHKVEGHTNVISDRRNQEWQDGIACILLG
jgi:hypothetical protein